MKFLAMLLIRIYQWTLSPLVGNVCRFTPSCSKYGYEAFKRHGFLKGFWLTSKRVVKCNPWCNHCGIDEVP